MIYFLTVNYYCSDLIGRLIDSISHTPGLDYQIIIVNNSIDDDSIHQFDSPSTLIIDAKKIWVWCSL